MRECNAVFSAPGFVGIVPDFFLYLRHEYATNMQRPAFDSDLGVYPCRYLSRRDHRVHYPTDEFLFSFWDKLDRRIGPIGRPILHKEKAIPGSAAGSFSSYSGPLDSLVRA